MRKITRDSVAAFLARRSFSRGNMLVRTESDSSAVLYLHGNMIARVRGYGPDYTVTLFDAGWQTPTTKDRLNGVLHALGWRCGIHARAFAWYFGQEHWQGAAVIEVRDNTLASVKTVPADAARADVLRLAA